MERAPRGARTTMQEKTRIFSRGTLVAEADRIAVSRAIRDGVLPRTPHPSPHFAVYVCYRKRVGELRRHVAGGIGDPKQ